MQSRLWHQNAVKGQTRVCYTEPYVDANTGLLNITLSYRVLDALSDMNESTDQVQNASQEITTASQAIINDVDVLQNETKVMGQSMDEMGLSADKMQDAGLTLAGVSKAVEASIEEIGKQIDLFESE